MQHIFVWVDIPVVDLDRAIAFYTAVLGAPVTKEGGPGFVFALLPHDDNIAGCLYTAPDNAPSQTGPLVYLNADGRLTEAVEAVTASGGSIVEAVHQIGEHGYRALILDSEGNKLALHSTKAA